MLATLTFLPLMFSCLTLALPPPDLHSLAVPSQPSNYTDISEHVTCDIRKESWRIIDPEACAHIIVMDILTRDDALTRYTYGSEQHPAGTYRGNLRWTRPGCQLGLNSRQPRASEPPLPLVLVARYWALITEKCMDAYPQVPYTGGQMIIGTDGLNLDVWIGSS